MAQKNITDQLDIIEVHLKSEEIMDQITALRKLKENVAQSTFSSQDLKEILPLIFRLYREGDAVLKTDVIDVLCLTGKQDLLLIDPVFKELTEEVEKKNQFHLPLIFSLMAKYSGSNIAKIQTFISKILEEGAMAYTRPVLQEILHDFWDQVLSQGFIYVSKNKSQITALLPEYRKDFPSLAEFFQEKLTAYEEFVQIETRRKQEAEKKLKEEQREREILRKRRVRIMDKLREQTAQDSAVQELASPQPPLVKTAPSLTNSDLSESDSESSTAEENPNFVSFSSLGLKKKGKPQEDP